MQISSENSYNFSILVIIRNEKLYLYLYIIYTLIEVYTRGKYMYFKQ